RVGTISRRKTDASTRSGRSGRSTARAATSSRRTRNRSNGDGSHDGGGGRGGRGQPRGSSRRESRPVLPVPARGAQRAAQGDLADVRRAEEGDDRHHHFRVDPGDRDRFDGRVLPVGVREAGCEDVLVPELRWYAIQTTAGHENK